MNESGKSAIAAGDKVVSVSGVKALEKKVKQLEQMLGRKTMEAEILRDALEIAQAKRLISRLPLRYRTIPLHRNSRSALRIAFESL